jgi:small-conductance mechanosensitive channel
MKLSRLSFFLLVLCLPAEPGFAAPAGAADAPAATQPAAAPEAQIARLRQKLADASAELAEAMARSEQSTPGDVASPEEIIESQFLTRQMMWAYQREIDTLSKAQSMRQSRAVLEREAADWTGLQHPPPYSFTLVDGLREAAAFQQLRLDALKAMDAALEEEASRRKDALEEAGGKLRQANERLEGGASNPRLVWLRDLEALRQRLAEVRVEGFQVEQGMVAEERAEARLRLDFIRRQLSEAEPRLAFPAEDKARAQSRLAAERQSLQAELEAVQPPAGAARKALASAGAAMDQAFASRAEPGRLAELGAALEYAREQADNAMLKTQSLSRMLDLLRLRANVWELRWAGASARDAEATRQAYLRIAKLQAGIKPVKEYLEQRLKLTAAQIYDTEAQSQEPAPAGAAKDRLDLHAVYVEREQIYRRMLRSIQQVEHELDLWRQDLDERRQGEPWAERALGWSAQLRAAAADAWAFELFAVEDTIEVEGQAVTGKRSVTLGKVATALLILVAGLALSIRLAGIVERLAVRRGHLDAGSARIARRWVLFLAGAVLVVASMMMVKIPLTVFAFAGGALAIGAGFGMQNLLKNLISGLMLLWERPFRPGDLVEVGGIRGRVVDIGVRSSQLRDASGIETVIPNSTFVEENVTNWTLSSRSVRIAIKLGVAYGTDAQDMVDLLKQAAERHGLIQKEPAPQVLFEDFGADALQFGLYVWVELKPGVDWPLVASDLRHMIYKTLAAHGIVMAFPQRDVHLDAAQPLQVRVLHEAV